MINIILYNHNDDYKINMNKLPEQAALMTLINFLIAEVRSINAFNFFIDLVCKMDEGGGGGGNVYLLSQFNALVVIDYSYWDDNEYEEDDDRPAVSPNAFVTTKEHMLEILKQWQYAVHQDHKRIVFLQDNDGKVTITPEN